MNQQETMKNLQFIEKPWGNFKRFTLNESTTVKIIRVKVGESTSLQSHKNRSEFWKVLKGNGVFIIDNKEQQANVGDEFFIKTEMVHRLSAGAEDLEILEISFGHFDENDITRIEDKYGRA